MAEETTKTEKGDPDKRRKERIYGTAFLLGVAGMSAIAGFGRSLATAKRQDPRSFNEGLLTQQGLRESGTALALRALAWGSVYAITGCSLLFYTIWKLSGAQNLQDFRVKAGNILPRIPKNDPPQSRTEFENLTDLLRYVSEEWNQEKPSTE